MDSFYIGQQIKIDAAFTNLAGAAADPTDIVAEVRTPSGEIDVYTYGTDADLTKLSTGSYRLLYTVDDDGLYHWRFAGTGAVIAAIEGQFRGYVSHFE